MFDFIKKIRMHKSAFKFVRLERGKFGPKSYKF